MTDQAEIEPFEPQLGDPGSWTRLPDGGVGQVWAPVGCQYGAPGRDSPTCRHKHCPPSVWVADGTTWHIIERTDLASLTTEAPQDGLFA